MTRISYEQAVAMGCAHLWPKDDSTGKGHATIVTPLPAELSKAPTRKFDSKLELNFWQRLEEAFAAGVFSEIDHHAIKVRAIGEASWYTPDFATRDHARHRTIWETKGYMYEKDRLRLIGAAARFPEWGWVCVTRPKDTWVCRHVTAAGIDPRMWRPDWL